MQFFHASGNNGLTLGTGNSFSTAISGGDTTKELVEIDPERCLRGIKCKNGDSPSNNRESEEFWHSIATKKTRCTNTDNSLSYCVNCVTDREMLVDDAMQPKKYECQDGE
jgi:hypothetical protein